MEYIEKYKKYKKKYVNKIIGGANPPSGAQGSTLKTKREDLRTPLQVPEEVPVPQQEDLPEINLTCREKWFANFDFTQYTALRTPSEWLTYFFPDGYTYFQLNHPNIKQNENFKNNKKMKVTDLQILMLRCMISSPRLNIADFKKGMGWS